MVSKYLQLILCWLGESQSCDYLESHQDKTI